MDAPAYHQHHHPGQPPSPVSSTDGSSPNSRDSLSKSILQSQHHLLQQRSQALSIPSQNPNNLPFSLAYAEPSFPPPTNPDYSDDPSVHQDDSQRPFRTHPRSPPPEPAYPTGEPGQQPASWPDYNYLPRTDRSDDDDHPSPEQHRQSNWPERPSPPTSLEDTAEQVDQLEGGLPLSPPGSPPIPGRVTLTTTGPYHSHHHYPISPPGPSAHSHQSKQYSFVSLPGNAMRKRPRRRYDEIERLYRCNWDGCTKSYGTLNHLNAHVTMQRHGPKRTPGEFKEMRKLWRKQKKEGANTESAGAGGDEASDGDEQPIAGPSGASYSPTASTSASRERTRRKRRHTESTLPNIATLEAGEDRLDEEYARLSVQQGHSDLNRRVSYDDFHDVDRRGSGGSGDGSAAQPEPSSSRTGLAGALPIGESHPPPLASPPVLHPSGQPAAGPSSLPPLAMDPPQAVQYWHPSQQSQPGLISPPTTAASHHIPAPGPLSLPSSVPMHHSASHGRQLSYPQPPVQHTAPPGPAPYQSTSAPQQMMHQYPNPVQQMQSSHMSYSQAGVAPHTPPQAPGAISHHPLGSTTSPPHMSTHQYTTASPTPQQLTGQRLHSGSIIITPLASNHPHRASYPTGEPSTSTTSPPYGAQGGLPGVYETRRESEDARQAPQPPAVPQQSSWEAAYAPHAPPPPHRPETTPYSRTTGYEHTASRDYPAATVGRDYGASVGAPSREYPTPGQSQSRDYAAGQVRTDSYPSAPRSDSFSAPMPPARAESYPSGGPEAYPAPPTRRGRDSYSGQAPDPYAASRTYIPPPQQQPQQHRVAPSAYDSYRGEPPQQPQQQQYMPYNYGRQGSYSQPPPQQAHHPGQYPQPGHPQQLPSAHTPMPDPYGRGHPGPSEGQPPY